MAEFDDKLNSLLSNPEAMDQIMKMAQSLMGGGQTQESPGAPPVSGQGGPSPGQPPAGAWSPPQSGGFPPSQSGPASSGPPPGQGWGPPNAGGPSPGSWGTPPASSPMGGQPGFGAPGPDLSFLSGLGSIDPKTIASLLPVLRELGEAQNSNARQLLFALRPYLKPERQDKVERALQLARLFRVGKRFLLKGDGHV